MCTGTTFFGNSASRGGALYQEGGALIMRDSQLVDNTAVTIGGCIYAAGSALEVYNSTFRKNIASEMPSLCISVTSQDACAGMGKKTSRVEKAAACTYDTIYTAGFAVLC